jgi:hypothetical protein
MALSTDAIGHDSGQSIRSAPLFPVSRSIAVRTLPGLTAWTESRAGVVSFCAQFLRASVKGRPQLSRN